MTRKPKTPKPVRPSLESMREAIVDGSAYITWHIYEGYYLYHAPNGDTHKINKQKDAFVVEPPEQPLKCHHEESTKEVIVMRYR